MVCLFLAKAGVVLNKPEWIDEAEYQFLIHIRYLQDKVTGLFYHGLTAATTTPTPNGPAATPGSPPPPLS